MMTAYDTVGGGGLYWEEGKLNTKNTCSNGPGIILALQLYKSTQDKAYLDTALMLYNWVNEKLRAPSGIYYDNVSLPSLKTDRRTYSYNTGTMMQSAVYLYEITKEKKYLDAAISIADSSMTYFYGNQKFRDGYWFNAVLLRAYQHLYKFHKDKKYLQAFIGCVNNALMNDKDNRGLMGRSRTVDLTNQAGMMEILARLSQLQN
jgi:predicted alpha-1,6-mannanase (GH76 family)